MTDTTTNQKRMIGALTELLITGVQAAHPHAFEDVDFYDPAVIAAIQGYEIDDPDTAWNHFTAKIAGVASEVQERIRTERRRKAALARIRAGRKAAESAQVPLEDGR